MTQEERLRAVYDYAKETFSYRGAENVETGSTGWELGVAKTMLTVAKETVIPGQPRLPTCPVK